MPSYEDESDNTCDLCGAPMPGNPYADYCSQACREADEG
jgi:endogenous inhibitor of DNA gyrase (YacG/DUF329 family)